MGVCLFCDRVVCFLNTKTNHERNNTKTACCFVVVSIHWRATKLGPTRQDRLGKSHHLHRCRWSISIVSTLFVFYTYFYVILSKNNQFQFNSIQFIQVTDCSESSNGILQYKRASERKPASWSAWFFDPYQSNSERDSTQKKSFGSCRMLLFMFSLFQ